MRQSKGKRRGATIATHGTKNACARHAPRRRKVRAAVPLQESEVRTLQKNTLSSLVLTLEYLADFDRQRRYKNAVPFVHIPIELAAQWENYPRLLKEKRGWFIDILTQDQIGAIRSFDDQFGRLDFGKNFPDVEEVFELSAWKMVSVEAQKALQHFPTNTH